MIRKSAAVLLSMALTLSTLPHTVSAADTAAADETVTVIVELTDDPVLKADEVKAMGAAEYNENRIRADKSFKGNGRKH